MITQFYIFENKLETITIGNNYFSVGDYIVYINFQGIARIARIGLIKKGKSSIMQSDFIKIQAILQDEENNDVQISLTSNYIQNIENSSKLICVTKDLNRAKEMYQKAKIQTRFDL